MPTWWSLTDSKTKSSRCLEVGGQSHGQRVCKDSAGPQLLGGMNGTEWSKDSQDISGKSAEVKNGHGPGRPDTNWGRYSPDGWGQIGGVQVQFRARVH